jgi:hypothetical protein
MTGRRADLGRFVLRVFLWLPPCFAAWYFTAPYHSAVAAGFARFFVALFNATLISATEQQAIDLVFVTRLQVQQAPGQLGVLAVEVNPLVYSYGLALFLALMLAARTRWWKVLAGAAILFPFQGWGIGFDFLAQLGAKLGPEVAAQAGLLGAREAIALAYQVGNLVFPSLVPVAVFVAFSRAYIEGLVPAGIGSAGVRPEAR